MPSAKLVVQTKIPNSFRNEKVKGMFDVNRCEIINEWNVDIPIEGIKWNIGVIVGSSGSGKTTIAKKIFKDYEFFDGFLWDNAKTVIDNFDESFSPKQITEILSKVGFSSPPDWLKPFSALSNGQKMRVEIARILLEKNNPVIYDEFSSVVDRQVAKIGSYAIQKYIRKENKQFIALSCHYDILEWLQPDWVYDVSKNEFKKDFLWRRPEIKCDIRTAEQSEWKIFKKFHYLSSEHNNASHKYIVEINNIPVAWCSVLHFPHPKIKNMKKIHRIVVLPDYQGIGIGSKFLDKIAEIYSQKKQRVTITTSTPAFINSLNRDKKWAMTRKPSRVGQNSESSSIKTKTSADRLTASFEYRKESHGNA